MSASFRLISSPRTLLGTCAATQESSVAAASSWRQAQQRTVQEPRREPSAALAWLHNDTLWRQVSCEGRPVTARHTLGVSPTLQY